MHDIDKLSGILLRTLRNEGMDYPIMAEAVDHARAKIEAVEWATATTPSRFSSDAIADEIEDYLGHHWRCLPRTDATRLRDVVASALKKAALGCVGTQSRSAEAILHLLTRPDEWSYNREIVDAFGIANKRGNHSLTAHWRDTDEMMGSDSMLVTTDVRGRSLAPVRGYNKRGIIKAALRARTDPAKAFQVLAADILAEAIDHPDFAKFFATAD